MIDLETPSQTDEHQKRTKRVLVAGLLAAAAAAIAFVAIRNDDPVSPVDLPSPTVTVPVTVSVVDFPNLTTTFVSPRNGFSVKYFDRGEGTLTPAKDLWDPGNEQASDGVDVVETGLAAVFKGASMNIPGLGDGTSLDEYVDGYVWTSLDEYVDEYVSPPGCGTPRSQQAEVTIDGQSGRISECPNEIQATVVAGGRIYLFTLLHDRSDARAVFDTFAATIDLTPETAVDIPNLTTTFVSPTNGFSFKFLDRGEDTLTPAKEPWDPHNEHAYDGFDVANTGMGAHFKAASTEIPDGVSIDEWLDEYISTGGCGGALNPRAEVTIDGQSGRISECPNEIQATVVAGGRVYLFTQVSDRSDAGAFFDAWVATIDLTPETAAVP